jgi:N-acetyl-anhydromuramyl-L-alanine amidase AmpD
MQFIEARWYTPVSVKRRIDFIVIHDMEMTEEHDTAERCARFFATTDRKASAHYNVDDDSIVQSVRENDIAYHAPPNTHSIGIEHAGFARQSRDQWLDPYGVRMLTRSAGLMAELLDKYDLPTEFLGPDELRAGGRGVTTHANVSKAWGQTSHTDPGPDFPIAWYMDRVRAARSAPQPTPQPVPPEDDDMAFTDAQLINFARVAVQAELGDENVGAFSDRVADKVIARLPACDCPTTAGVDVDALAEAVAAKLAARLAQ